MNRILAAAVACLCALGLAAQPADMSRVTIAVRAHDGAAFEALLLTLQPADASNTGEVTAVLRGGSVVVELPRGAWSLDASAPTVWHTRQYVLVPAQTEVAVDVWPRASVRGRIIAEAPRPSSVRLQFIGAASDAAEQSASCDVRDDVFTCALPAGAFSLRLDAPGFVAHVFPSTKLTAGEEADLGALRFRRGESILGRAIAPKGVDPKRIRLRAVPRQTERSLRRIDSGPPVGAWLLLDGVAPGAYSVTATHPDGLSSEATEVTVKADAQMVIPRPLVLVRPRRILVEVTPPLSREGAPWSVELLTTPALHREETRAFSNASAAGKWSSPALSPGSYDVVVRDGRGDVFRQSVVVDDRDVPLPARITYRTVRGSVRLDGEPLAARLRFSSSAGRSVTTESDAKGLFETVLPDAEAEAWDVDVRATTPAIDRRIERAVTAGQEELALDLPDYRLAGTVVNRAGEPVAYAIVTVSGGPDASFVQANTLPDGSFVAAGLALGSYRIQASALEQDSAPLEVELTESGPSDLRIVVDAARLLRGRVVSRYGPVAGVSVLVRPTDVPVLGLMTWTTDDQGRFTAILPPNSTEFDLQLAPPGFAFSTGHARYQPEELTVEITQEGGTLVLADAPPKTRLQLFHDGAEILLPSLAGLWPTTREGNATVIPQMEPGSYRVCASAAAAEPRCVDGFLAPNGYLRLASGE